MGTQEQADLIPNLRVREPLTYREMGDHSFFADLVAADRGDELAGGRLSRHQAEMAVEFAGKRTSDYRQWSNAVDVHGIEARVNPNTGLGTGGEFVPPAWLISRFAAVARAGRVLADLINPIPLPDGVGQISVPKITVNEQVGVQATQGSASTSVDMTTSSFTSQVVTIAGNTDVSTQLWEQATPAHLDAFVFPDLTKDYNQRLELQLISGTGANGQLTGVLNVPSNIVVTYTDATPTAAAWYKAFGQLFGQMGDSLLHPPEVALLAPRRWAWLATSTDGSGRPFMPPGLGSVVDRANLYGNDPLFGPILGVPAGLDGAVPLTTGGNQDPSLLLRTSSMYFFEGAPKVAVLNEAIAGTLQTRLVFRNYVAFIGARYPASVGVLSGTGCAAPPGF